MAGACPIITATPANFCRKCKVRLLPVNLTLADFCCVGSIGERDHEACEDLRQVGEIVSSWCEEPVGYDREFNMITHRDGNVELTHAACRPAGTR